MEPRVYSREGHTLRWYEVAEAASGAARRVMVDVGPASPTHVLRVLYSIDGGPERAAQGWSTGRDPMADLQTFAAILPATPHGKTLHWRPVLQNGPHEIDPGLPKRGETKSALPLADTPAKTPAAPPEQNRFPYVIEFLARVTVPLEDHPRKIGDTPDGLQIVFPLGKGGTVCGPKLNGTIEHTGGDWMRVRTDGVGISSIRVVVACDDGSVVMGEYGGVVNFGADGYAALSAGGGPARADVQLVPRFLTASKTMQWLNRAQCVGIGRVSMETLLVEYDLYAIHSGAAALGKGETDHG